MIHPLHYRAHPLIPPRMCARAATTCLAKCAIRVLVHTCNISCASAIARTSREDLHSIPSGGALPTTWAQYAPPIAAHSTAHSSAHSSGDRKQFRQKIGPELLLAPPGMARPNKYSTVSALLGTSQCCSFLPARVTDGCLPPYPNQYMKR